MVIRLYKQFVKRVDSTKQVTGDGVQFDVSLKRETSIQSPIFLLSNFDPSYNYVYVPSWGRYYFINDFILGNTNLFEIHCSFDALASYKASIGNTTAFIERSSSNYNVNYNDDVVSVAQKVSNRHVALTPMSQFSGQKGSYIVRIAGGDEDGVSTYVVDTLANLAAIFDKDRYISSGDDSWIQVVGNYVFDPYEYVVGLYWSPLKLDFYRDNGAELDIIHIKWFSTGMSAYKLPNNKTVAFGKTIVECDNDYLDFRKYNPAFSRYNLTLPAIGTIPIDGNNVEDLYITYDVALDDGSAMVTLYNGTDLTRISTYQANLYSSLQYGSDSQNVSQILGDVMTAVGGFASGNVAMGTTGSVTAIKNIIVPSPSIGGGSGGIGIRNNSNIFMSCENYASGDLDVENFGRPCNKKLLISTLSGFVKCGGASISNIAGTDTDKETINNYLNSGFYYE